MSSTEAENKVFRLDNADEPKIWFAQVWTSTNLIVSNASLRKFVVKFVVDKTIVNNN